MVATAPTSGPVVADETERSALAALVSLIDAEQGGLLLTDDRGASVEVPETVHHLLRQMVHTLAADRPVAIVALQRELTIRSAAELLNVQVPYMVQLLDQDDLPSTGTGASRRVRFEELMTYKARRDVERRAAMIELVRLSEELGLYDLDDVPGPPRQEEATLGPNE